MAPAASVIVRCRDKEGTIVAALDSLRAQTVVPEIIVVDSGSRDRTLELAEPRADRIIEIPPETFTYGRALNVGARAAQGPVHFALSAHCVVPRADWVERAVAHYARADVAATNGRRAVVHGREISGPFYATLEDAMRDLYYWGFSNHASSWRAATWEEFPFEERLGYAEDREWSLRVLAAGWTIVFDEELFVDQSHQWRQGALQYCRRQREQARAMWSFADLPPYRVRDLVAEWWHGQPDPRPAWRRRLNPVRTASLVAKYQGQLAGRRARH
jgi:glycosyltransferase involved in cell wall biosynthesis